MGCGMAKLVYQRKNGKWEARYKKSVSEDGKILYGTVYGDSEEEAIRKREELLGYDPEKPKQATEMNLLILGAGTQGRDILEIAETLRVFHKISFLDDSIRSERVLGTCKDTLRFRWQYPCAFVAIDDCDKRRDYVRILKEQGFLMPNIISATANVSPKAMLGEGIAILPNSTVGDAVIGDFSILASNSLVNSGSKVGSYCHIDCGGIVLKDTRVPDGTWVQSGNLYQ